MIVTSSGMPSAVEKLRFLRRLAVKSLLPALTLALISEVKASIGRYTLSCTEQCQKNEYKSGCDGATTVGKQSTTRFLLPVCYIDAMPRHLQGNVTSVVHTALLANMHSGVVEPHLANVRTAHCAPLAFTRREVAGRNPANVLSA